MIITTRYYELASFEIRLRKMQQGIERDLIKWLKFELSIKQIAQKIKSNG